MTPSVGTAIESGQSDIVVNYTSVVVHMAVLCHCLCADSGHSVFRRRSRHQLSYQQAQDIVDRRPLPSAVTPGQVVELRAMLDLLVSTTDAWRQRRLEVTYI